MTVITSFKHNLYQFIFCISLCALSCVSFHNPLNAFCDRHPHESKDPLELALALETNFWTLVQNHEVKKFSKLLASIFQGINISGAFDREEEIAGLATATLSSFSLNNPRATRFRDVLVFTYDFVATDSNLTNGPTISVWKKHDHSWKIVSHSFVPFLVN